MFEAFLGLRPTVAAMPSKGFRRVTLSTDTKLNASDTARKPLNPLLGIAVVELNPPSRIAFQKYLILSEICNYLH